MSGNNPKTSGDACKMKSLLPIGLGALAIGLVTTAAQASPTGLAGALDQGAESSGLVENVTWYGNHYYRPYYGYRWYRHRRYGHNWYGYRHYGWYPRYGYRHW